jgi:hypothetical protein
MITTNPFSELSALIGPAIMQMYIILMIVAVIGGTILDTIHKKSAQYFFENAKKAEKNAKRTVSGGEKIGLMIKTLLGEVMTSSEFNNVSRRISHLLLMYGFIMFMVSTIVQVFLFPSAESAGIWSILWHVGAAMVMVGGYWFWLAIRVDVNSEGKGLFPLTKADIFIVSLLLTTTFGLAWSLSGAGASGLSLLFLVIYVAAMTVLFTTVLWSKFAHMFFKPAAAYQKKITKADGSQENLPDLGELSDPTLQARYPDIPEYMGTNPPNMGLGIKREEPNHY